MGTGTKRFPAVGSTSENRAMEQSDFQELDRFPAVGSTWVLLSSHGYNIGYGFQSLAHGQFPVVGKWAMMCASLVARNHTQWIPTVGKHAGTVIQRRLIYTSIGFHMLEYIYIYTCICILCIYGFQYLANGQVPVFGI